MTKTKFFGLAVVACVAVMPSVASAQVKKVGNGYLLRMKYVKGQTHSRTLTTTISGLPANTPSPLIKNGTMKLIAPYKETVDSVAGNVATVTVTLGPFTSPGMDQPVQPVTKTTGKVDNLGNRVGGGPTGGSFGAHFPKDPVKVGGMWTSKVPMSGMASAGGQAEAKFKFGGIKKVKGRDLAILTISLVPNAQIKSGSGTMYLLPSDGSLAGGNLNMEMINPQAATPIKVAINIVAGK